MLRTSKRLRGFLKKESEPALSDPPRLPKFIYRFLEREAGRSSRVRFGKPPELLSGGQEAGRSDDPLLKTNFPKKGYFRQKLYHLALKYIDFFRNHLFCVQTRLEYVSEKYVASLPNANGPK